MLLLVGTLVTGFQVLGTLMVVGIMMLPATAARFWAATVGGQMRLAAMLGALASYLGLLVSYHTDVPASPAIILMAGILYFISIVAGPQGGLWQAARQARARRRRLYESLNP
jgi:zinc/manganese transport system permease protein